MVFLSWRILLEGRGTPWYPCDLKETSIWEVFIGFHYNFTMVSLYGRFQQQKSHKICMNYKSEGYIIHKAWDFFFIHKLVRFRFYAEFSLHKFWTKRICWWTELSSRHDVTTFHTSQWRGSCKSNPSLKIAENGRLKRVISENCEPIGSMYGIYMVIYIFYMV